jgi:hypothetical protein
VDGSISNPLTSRADWPKIRRDPRNSGYYPRVDPAAVEDAPALIGRLSVAPNPVRPDGLISLRLGGAGATRISIFDPAGRRIGGMDMAGAACRTLPVRSLSDRGITPGVWYLRPEGPGDSHGHAVRLVLCP